jgi:hypothetical protein
MAYNNQEEKKLAERIAKKTEHTRQFFKDKKAQQTLMESLEMIIPAVNQRHEKAEHEPLSAEELELLNKMEHAIEQVKQTTSDAQLLRANDLFTKSTAQFFHLKKLAEEGNEDARKAYEEMLPSFKKVMEPNLNGSLVLN